MPGSIALRFLLPILLLLGAFPAAAQLPAPEPAAEEAAPAAVEADPFERETPRSTVTSLIRALAEQDYVLAGNYFALDEEDPERGETLARTLQASLDVGGALVPFAELSNEPTGTVGDGLPPELEGVGVLGGAEDTPILLERDEGAEGQPVWRVAPRTIAELEERAEQLAAAAPAESRFVIAGAPLADWALLVGLFVVVFAVLRLIAALIRWVLRRLILKPDGNGIFRFIDAALPPAALLFSVVAFQVWGTAAPISIVARQMLLRYVGIIAWVALAWFAVRLVDAIAGTLTSRMEGAERRQAVSVVALVRRAAKVVLIVVAGVAILDTLGIDVTTGIAALGIGGLALALGAQKTIENLVGSVTVIADRPIQVGDFCRVGDVLGTIEDIGMRSTRIRTLDRTLVTIPNGDFSSRQIENYALRDRFLFRPVIGLEYGISAAQLRQGIEIIENVLAEHPKVSTETRRAKLGNFGASSLDIEVFTYIEVPDFDESLVVRQELLLTIFERLEEAGLSVAFPTQTIYLRRDREGDTGGERAA